MKSALSTMQPHLSDHWFSRLKDSVDSLEASVAEGLVRNVQFVKWKYVINEAVAQTCNSANKSKADWADRILVLGAYNLPAALRQATRDGVHDRATLLTAMLPLHNLLQSAKPLIVKRGQAATTDSPGPAKGYMTCQCCARQIMAATGVIAAHGFRRPSGMSQTASCDGAGSLPWESDRSRLGELIEGLKEQADRLKMILDDIVAERSPVSVFVSDRSASFDVYGRKPTIRFEMTRQTSAEVLAKIPPDGGIPITTFDEAKARCIAGNQDRLHRVSREIEDLQRRYESWQKTHVRDPDSENGWTPIDALFDKLD